MFSVGGEFQFRKSGRMKFTESAECSRVLVLLEFKSRGLYKMCNEIDWRTEREIIRSRVLTPLISQLAAALKLFSYFSLAIRISGNKRNVLSQTFL